MKIVIAAILSVVAVCGSYLFLRDTSKKLQDRKRVSDVVMQVRNGVRQYFSLLFKTHEDVEAQ